MNYTLHKSTTINVAAAATTTTKMISNRNLRPRQHDRQSIRKSAHVNDSLFIIRMLYRDSY